MLLKYRVLVRDVGARKRGRDNSNGTVCDLTLGHKEVVLVDGIEFGIGNALPAMNPSLKHTSTPASDADETIRIPGFHGDQASDACEEA